MKWLLPIIFLMYTFPMVVFGSGNVEVVLNQKFGEDFSKNIYELIYTIDGNIIAKRVYQNGKTLISEGNIPDGLVVERYPSGRIRNMHIYKNQLRNGPAFGFYESGVLKLDVKYINGNPTGVGKRYYENGILEAEWEISNGKEIKRIDYSMDGKVINTK